MALFTSAHRPSLSSPAAKPASASLGGQAQALVQLAAALQQSPAVQRLTQLGTSLSKSPLGQTSGVAQRVVRLNGASVLPDDHASLHRGVREIIEKNGLEYSPAHAAQLEVMLSDRNNIYDAANIDALAYNLIFNPDDPSLWEKMTAQAISPAELEEGRTRRHKRRYASMMTLSDVQISKRVPGMKKLRDQELLRLDEMNDEEREYWIRTRQGGILTVKWRKISKDKECRIIAAGNPDDPSYVVFKKNRHHGHRYKADQKKKHRRTYGSKKDREGYEYKGSGLVDGHAIQVQDDQKILGPYSGDAPHWETVVNKTDGSSVKYPDAKYLPKNEKDEKWIETHPYNFYWENQEQGKHMRQKGIEAPTLRNKSSFMMLSNHSGNHTFNPNSGRASKNIYPVPGSLDYLVSSRGGQQHLIADNRPTADYSRPSQFDSKTGLYAEVPGKIPSAKKNTSLGGAKVKKHLKLITQKDTTKFPFATVLKPSESSFTFKPQFREEDDDYQSPPPSPLHIRSGIEEEDVEVPAEREEMAGFEYKGKLAENAEYDQAKDKTKLKLVDYKKVASSSMISDGSAFFAMLKGKKGKAVVPGKRSAGVDYMPTAAQELFLANRNVGLDWVPPDGRCMLSAIGVVTGRGRAAVRTEMLNALDNAAHPQHGAAVHEITRLGQTVPVMRQVIAHLEMHWANPAADLVLPLAAIILGQGFTVVQADGTTVDVNGGGHLLVRVSVPLEHYHATRAKPAPSGGTGGSGSPP